MSRQKHLAHETAFRTLILWLGWASIALLVLFGLQLEINLIGYIAEDKARVTWVIAGLFLVAFFISFWLALSITQEMSHAIRIGTIASETGLVGINPNNRMTIAVERYFVAIRQVTESNDRPDVEALLDVEFARYQRTSFTVEVFGTMLITLGLIGTVMGLTLTLTGLATSIAALGEDQERLMSGLRSAMGGMGTAFYATLMGAVMGGVLLRVFALITHHGIDGLVDYLKKITWVYCAADIKPTLERDLRSTNAEIVLLGENVRMLQTAMDETRRSLVSFRDEATRLKNLSDDADSKQTLRDAVVLQHYYSDLLQEEVKMLNRINRSWWAKLKRSVAKARVTSRDN